MTSLTTATWSSYRIVHPPHLLPEESLPLKPSLYSGSMHYGCYVWDVLLSPPSDVFFSLGMYHAGLKAHCGSKTEKGTGKWPRTRGGGVARGRVSDCIHASSTLPGFKQEHLVVSMAQCYYLGLGRYHDSANVGKNTLPFNGFCGLRVS